MKFYKKNIYLNYYLRCLRNFNNNLKVKKITKAFEKIDSIKNFKEFSKELKDLKISNQELFSYKFLGGESLLYGHINVLYEYAQLKLKTTLELPSIEHGINFGESENFHIELTGMHNRLYQGDYKKIKINNNFPFLPVYCIGPYIHYSNYYYNNEQYVKKKMKLGKTLLVFPVHTYEKSTVKYDCENFVKKVEKIAKENFDSILVCAYWLNATDEVYQMFKAIGAEIVCAGMRTDACFLKRLKTIISLSDTVLGNDIGTYIGYAFYMGKEVVLLNEVINRYDKNNPGNNYERNLKEFYNAFSCMKEKNTSKLCMQKKLYDKFWGGESLIKTADEIKNIIYISKEILKKSNGFVDRFPLSTYELHQDLKYSNNLADKDKYKLLNESLTMSN